MKKGSKGSDVRELQKLLIAAGYSCGRYGADGDFGNDTDAAVRLYQKDHGFEVTGIVTDEMLERLRGNRLSIPGIAVRLYEGSAQGIVDATDSAAIFRNSCCDGWVIADHSNQKFSKLKNIKIGAKGTITWEGKTHDIQCVKGFMGRNNGSTITYNNGDRLNEPEADFLTYTCNGCWQNILVYVWKKI